ncbi:MAG: DUF1992 domain-containing protein [Planctomycetaceae bacterium]|nr:DUF1992 domain-containing protein [Planctomycetaceae bacterium]
MKWESFADQRIREAQAEGQFENLPGFGQPIPGIDEPLDENWWIKNKLRNEGLTVIPPVLEARRDIERTRSEIVDIANELLVRRRLQELNDRIEKAIHSPIAGPPGGVMLLDVEQELIAWRAARDAKEIDVK